MIHIVKGDMFAGGHDVLVNAVNCDGVMGAGLAKMFAVRYPRMYDAYRQICKAGKLQIGSVHSFQDRDTGIHIINFPTVGSLRELYQERKQVYDNVRRTLPAFVARLEDMQLRSDAIHSVGIPALGAGIMRGKWSILLCEITEACLSSKLADLDIYIYWPRG